MSHDFILVDIDHTMADAYPRDHMIGVEPWDSYHEASINDAPFTHIVNMINRLAGSGMHVIGFTARPAKWRNLTMVWFIKHNVFVHELLMREDLDFRPAPEVKLELARARFGTDEGVRTNVAFVLEDRDDVTAAFQSIGVPVLQVFGRRTPA